MKGRGAQRRLKGYRIGHFEDPEPTANWYEDGNAHPQGGSEQLAQFSLFLHLNAPTFIDSLSVRVSLRAAAARQIPVDCASPASPCVFAPAPQPG